MSLMLVYGDTKESDKYIDKLKGLTEEEIQKIP